MNGLSLLALIAVACGLVVAYRYGRIAGRRDGPTAAMIAAPTRTQPPRPPAASDVAAPPARASTPPDAELAPVAAATPARPPADRAPVPTATPAPEDPAAHGHLDRERGRLIVAYEAETARLRQAARSADAERYRQQAFAQDRSMLLRDLATARGDVARYRQVVVDLENDAPPPILGGPGAPDDLKLIVGIGPALERMLQQLGIGSYRQIARWTEHDIEAFDARLPEFPGRIRRDAWVTQARELHYNKYGERP